MLSKLTSLSIASLRNLDEEAYKFYDRKHDRDFYHTALLTRFYTQHALRPYIDSEMNHIRHFIKIPFIMRKVFSPAHPKSSLYLGVCTAMHNCMES